MLSHLTAEEHRQTLTS